MAPVDNKSSDNASNIWLKLAFWTASTLFCAYGAQYSFEWSKERLKVIVPPLNLPDEPGAMGACAMGYLFAFFACGSALLTVFYVSKMLRLIKADQKQQSK